MRRSTRSHIAETIVAAADDLDATAIVFKSREGSRWEGVIELFSHCDDRASRIVSAFVVGDSDNEPEAQSAKHDHQGVTFDDALVFCEPVSYGEFLGTGSKASAFMYRSDRIVVMIVTTDTIDGLDVVYEISDSIAKQTGVDICELPPLYETIDPDALDAFLRCSDSTDAHPERSVEFSYYGYRVTVASTGQIQLQREPELTSPISST